MIAFMLLGVENLRSWQPRFAFMNFVGESFVCIIAEFLLMYF